MNKRFFILLCVIVHNIHLIASLSNNPYDDAYSKYKEQFEQIDHDKIAKEKLLIQLGFVSLKQSNVTSLKGIRTPTGSIFIQANNGQLQRLTTAQPYDSLETKEFRIMEYGNRVQYKICANGDAFILKPLSDDWIFVPEGLREFIN